MNFEQRILLRVATSKDATLAGGVLARAQIEAHPCAGMTELIAEFRDGAGALMVAEETLNEPALAQLSQALQGQPPWSDVPLIVLARQGADSTAIALVMDRFPNVTVIERPVRVASMISAIRSTLRARQRQYEVRSLLQGLREADDRKTEFLATLAHELRNPLAPLRTGLALLSQTPSTPETARYHDMMRRQVDHMTRLVDDLMEVSRITRGKINLQLLPLSIDETIAGAIELSRPQIESGGHALKVDLPDQPLLVRGDRVRLTQIFSNLLNNAAKYTPRGGRIGVWVGREGEGALIRVSDTGNGLAPEMLDSIFEMFVQVSGTAKTAQGGLGIGLTLVRSMVELHGGSVAASSDGLQRGATFTVRLPLINGAEAAAPTAPDAAPTDLAMATAAHPALRHTVLVVDDNRDAADSLAELLRTVGATVFVAHSAAQALQLATTGTFDVAVLDIGMPGMDGCELASRLRAQPAHAGMRLIALTGWGQSADRHRIAEAGFDHHLLKPVDFEDLIQFFGPPRVRPEAAV